jgi:16S rRNA (guanine527-N7)-methyltransferase
VASLGELVELSFPLLEVGGTLVAWKRTAAGAEIAAAEPILRELGGGAVDIDPVDVAGLEDHVLVIVTKLGPTPAEYPRNPTRRRTP